MQAEEDTVRLWCSSKTPVQSLPRPWHPLYPLQSVGGSGPPDKSYTRAGHCEPALSFTFSEFQPHHLSDPRSNGSVASTMPVQDFTDAQRQAAMELAPPHHSTQWSQWAQDNPTGQDLQASTHQGQPVVIGTNPTGHSASTHPHATHQALGLSADVCHMSPAESLGTRSRPIRSSVCRALLRRTRSLWRYRPQGESRLLGGGH